MSDEFPGAIIRAEDGPTWLEKVKEDERKGWRLIR